MTIKQVNGDTFPRPDPTKLTTEQLDREIGNLRELFDIKLQLVLDRSNLADKAIEDQHTSFVLEVNQRFHELSAKVDINRGDINTLRETRAATIATDARSIIERERRTWSLGQSIAVITSAVAMLLVLLEIVIQVMRGKV